MVAGRTAAALPHLESPSFSIDEATSSNTFLKFEVSVTRAVRKNVFVGGTTIGRDRCGDPGCRIGFTQSRLLLSNVKGNMTFALNAPPAHDGICSGPSRTMASFESTSFQCVNGISMGAVLTLSAAYFVAIR